MAYLLDPLPNKFGRLSLSPYRKRGRRERDPVAVETNNTDQIGIDPILYRSDFDVMNDLIAVHFITSCVCEERRKCFRPLFEGSGNSIASRQGLAPAVAQNSRNATIAGVCNKTRLKRASWRCGNQTPSANNIAGWLQLMFSSVRRANNDNQADSCANILATMVDHSLLADEAILQKRPNNSRQLWVIS